MSVNQKTTWYVFSRDSHTNEVIAEALKGLSSAEKFSTLQCADGTKRDLCEVPDYAFVARLTRSKKDLRADFEVFRTYGSGLPTVFDFPRLRKQTLKTLLARETVAHAANKQQKA